MRDVGLNKIFVEGKSDKLFIEILLHKFFNLDDKSIVICTNGKDNLITQPDLTDEMRRAENAKNLVIFDTDSVVNGGNRENRLREYHSIAFQLNIKFDIFLLPFNDERDGVLENLLNTCLHNKFSFFDDCWNTMIECVRNNEIENINIPAQKAFVFSKIDLFKNYRKYSWNYKSSSVYDYSDENIWNLDINENIELKKLIEFIDNNLFDTEN